MNYLQRKKLAFMSIANRVKGFIRAVSGVPPLVLTDCSDGDSLINYRVYGQSVQDGVPSPDNPAEVQCVGDRTVNLLSPYTGSKTENGVTWIGNEDGSLTVEGTPTGYTAITRTFTAKPNTTYCFSDCNNIYGLACDVTEYGEDGTIVKSSGGFKAHTITTTAETSAVRVGIKRSNDGVTIPKTTIYPQVQEGTTATPYEPYGKYKITVTARGRNLLDKDNANITPLYYNGGKYASGVAIKTFYLTCEAGKQYSITCSPKGGRLTVSFCTYFPLVSRDAFGYATDAAFTSITVTAPPAAEYMLVEFYNGNKCESGFTYEDALKYIMVEQGEVTEYEPYYAPVTTNIYLDEPLRKIGDYADYIDFEGGKVVRNAVDIKLSGNFTVYNDNVWQCSTGINLYMTKKELCTHFISSSSSTVLGMNNKNQLGKYVALSGATGLNMTIDEFNAWVDENDVHYFAALDEPTEEAISLPKLPTFKGTTIYEVGTTINPSGMDV
ncbi:MAG: hypothetical protein J6N52_03745, partial [Clostridia bacterium]|nr:hypothetical protein [Clostridia bacterium]